MPQNKPDTPSTFGRSMGRILIDGLKDSLKMMLFGGVLGAVALGTVGFFLFGWQGMLAGAAIGFVVGAVGLLLLD